MEVPVTTMTGARALMWVSAVLFSVGPTTALNTELCNNPLGMSDKNIPDDHITASSHFDGEVNAHYARAHVEVGGGAWCPRQSIHDQGLEYLEINLVKPHVVTKVEVQGRFGNGQGKEFTEQYKVQYWRPSIDHWIAYRDGRGNELLEGNSNPYLAKASQLSPPVTATRIRFVPYSNHPRTVCMRVEIYGCPRTDGLVSYSMQDGELRGGSDDALRDLTYDGSRRGDRLSGGLGQLSDGETGHTNFRVDSHGRERGYEWVGWNNDSRNPSEPIEIQFDFDQLRNFTAIHIHANNLWTKGAQVFTKADVWASMDGNVFEKVEEHVSEADKIFENARPVTIKLRRITAVKLKLELFFSARWILISEVTFDSVPCRCEELPLVETIPPSDMPPSDEPEVEKKAEISEDPHPPVDNSKKPAMGNNPGLLIGFMATLGVVFGTLPVFLIIMYYRNKMLKKGVKSQQYGNGNRKINLKVNEGPVTLNNGSIIGDYAHSKNRIYGDIGLSDEAAAMYQEPYRTPLNGQGFYSLGRSTIAYEEPLDMGPDAEDSIDYAVPDVTLTSGTRGHKFKSIPQFLPFVNALMDIPPPPIPPPPEEPSHAPPPTDVQGVIGSAFCALPESEMHKEDPSVVELFPYQVSLMQVIGESPFGFAQLCELEPNKSSSRQQINYTNRIHVVKKLKPQSCDITKDKFMKEIHILSQLHDENIARLAGVIAEEEGPVMVIQFTEYGDLYQFLRKHVTNEVETLPDECDDIDEPKHLSRGALIHIATQIASGMKYLEKNLIVHRDLAARNCLIGRNLSIKISDIALCRSIFAEDYCSIEGRSLLPVRWMAPESLIHSLYTIKTDVWSFGVTLWEILTMARERPLGHLNDSAAVENICQTCDVDGSSALLPQPTVYGREIYQMMTSCWRATDRQRPPFWEIHVFLKRKNMGYTVDYNME